VISVCCLARVCGGLQGDPVAAFGKIHCFSGHCCYSGVCMRWWCRGKPGADSIAFGTVAGAGAD
jgi:hypothetical protein